MVLGHAESRRAARANKIVKVKLASPAQIVGTLTDDGVDLQVCIFMPAFILGCDVYVIDQELI